MRALVLEAPGKCFVREIADPVPVDGCGVFDVTHCSICRTDAKMWQSGQRDLVLPRVLGHEMLVVDPADGRQSLVWPGDSCGKCARCLAGVENLCLSMKVLGFHLDGGFAERALVRRKNLIAIPAGLPSGVATLAEPLACGINAVEQSRIEPPGEVVVYGAGPAGLLLALALSDKGFDPLLCDLSDERLAVSAGFRSALGLRCAIPENLPAQVGFAFNANPTMEAVHDAIHRLRPGGGLCLFSGLTGKHDFDLRTFNEIHYRQLRVSGAYGCTRAQMSEAAELLCRRKEAAAKLVGRHVNLDQAPGCFPEILAGGMLKTIVVIKRKLLPLSDS